MLGQGLNLLMSLGVTTVLCKEIYRCLPDVHVPSRGLWAGSAVTSIPFNLGKTAIGLYIGNSHIDSSYGRAGSLVILPIWIIGSTQNLLIGAEFTQVYSQRQSTTALRCRATLKTLAQKNQQARRKCSDACRCIIAALD